MKTTRWPAPKSIMGDESRTALQFIAKIDGMISSGASSDTLWNYCVQYRTRALQDAVKTSANPSVREAAGAFLCQTSVTNRAALRRALDL